MVRSIGHRIIARVRCARGGCVFSFLLIKTALVRLLHVISGLVLGGQNTEKFSRLLFSSTLVRLSAHNLQPES